MSRKRAVCGIYTSERYLADGVEQLRIAGFRNTDVSVLFAENAGTRDFAHEKNSKAPEGAAAGAGSGAVLGGALGWLAGMGVLAIPGMGLFVAVGPIMGLMSGVGVGGAIGGLTGALIGSGMPEYEAKRYEGRVRKGGALISVHCDNPAFEKQAKKILENSGAQYVSASEEARADFGRRETGTPKTELISAEKR
jgi:hypothetical protein